MYIAVIGASEANKEIEQTAFQVGAQIAKAGDVLITGGLGGVMDAAAKGCKEAGGTSIGILPTDERSQASSHLDYCLVTGMGDARNVIIVRSADAVIAVGGEFGTLSEIGHALKMGKPVIGLDTWKLSKKNTQVNAIKYANSAEEALSLAKESEIEE